MQEDDSYFYERLNHYLEIGAIEISGMDQHGDVVYEIKECAKEIAPELWQSHAEYVDNALIELFEDGLIEIEYNEDLEAIIKISKEALEIARDMGIVDPDFQVEEDSDENLGN